MPVGKSIRIFLADATVTGIRYAELVNWTGHGLACPRNRLSELSAWPEASKPGVYLLFEARLGDAKPLAYIGESENVAERLTSHDRLKDFWNEVVIFTSKDENLTKAHVKFLESNLVAIAKKADRYTLENGNTPTESSLPRADKDAMAEFTDNIRMVLGTLGYPILEPLLRSAPVSLDVSLQSTQVVAGPVSTKLDNLTFTVNGLVAHGSVTDEGFVLKKGSQLSSKNMDSLPSRILQQKQKMQEDGRLFPDAASGHLELAEDVLTSSSSYAAALVAGTSRSGPQGWIAEDGRTLKMIEDETITFPQSIPE